jgi:uncharacterized protein YcbK (DUF882 family)
MPARFSRFCRFALGVAGLGVALTAWAEPATHPHRAAAVSAGAKATASAVRTTMPGSAAAAAYMSGRQMLVGWHAASTKTIAGDASGRPMLVLSTLNRGESLAVPSDCDDGTFASADLDRMAHLLRSAGGEEHPIDPRTLSLVYRIETHFGVPEIRVVSGYRVPKPGGHSNHGKGRAVDLIVPGVADEEVARFARGLGFVGVGVYPTSQFVHVDIRPRSYFWIDYSGPRMKNKESCIFPDVAAQGDVAAEARGQAPIEPFGVAMDVDAALHARGVAASPPLADDDEEDED